LCPWGDEHQVAEHDRWAPSPSRESRVARLGVVVAEDARVAVVGVPSVLEATLPPRAPVRRVCDEHVRAQPFRDLETVAVVERDPVYLEVWLHGALPCVRFDQ
jgi:hypothetical protein